MVWTLFRQQQQCGAQMPARTDRERRLGEAPGEATRDRAAQDHEQAGEALQPGDYPASRIEDRDDDITPSAPDPRVEWDDVVQRQRDPGRPQRQAGESDDLPPPEAR
jgi:hypothetical protein